MGSLAARKNRRNLSNACRPYILETLPHAYVHAIVHGAATHTCKIILLVLGRAHLVHEAGDLIGVKVPAQRGQAG